MPSRSDASRSSASRAVAPACARLLVIEIRGVRLAAGGVRLIGRQGRIAIDQLDALERHAKFFGDQLRLRD